MNKWIAAGVVAMAVVVAILWMRGGGEDGKPAEEASRPTTGGGIAMGKATIPTVRTGATKLDDVAGDLRLEGQVIDDAQQPVGNALVTLQGTERTATSAADGSFAFDALAAKRYRVSAHAGDLYSPLVTVRLGPKSDPAILHMQRGATMTVHVVDDRGPLAGASVRLDREPLQTADASGVVTFHGVGDFFHLVEATADGHAPGRVSMMLERDPGGVLDKTVTLQRGAPISGVVLGPDGKPVAGAQVDVEQVGARFAGTTEKADASGAWTVPALGAGKYTLTATSEVFGPGDPVPLELDGATPKRDIVLRVAVDAQLVGDVVDGAGHPVAGATVVFGSSVAAFGTSSKRADAAGHFEILGFPAGTYGVTAHDATRSSAITSVTIANDERASVRLEVQASGISGTVVDDKGQPVAEANVRAIPTQMSMMMGGGGDDVTDSAGRFDLGAIVPGEYRVIATWPGQDMRGQPGERIKTGTTDAKLVLPASATVTGRVTMAGTPVSFFGVSLSKFPANPYLGKANGVHAADGRFVLRNVAPEVTSVVIVAPGSARKVIADVAIAPGKTTDLGDIALAPGQHITGHVHDAAGTAVEGATVAIGRVFAGLEDDPLQTMFRGTYSTTTDATGAYHFDGIAAIGSDTITVTHPTRGAAPAAAVPAGDAVIDFTLVASGGIDGVIDGVTERGSMVSLLGGKTPDRATTGADGVFRFDNVLPGDYTVAVMPLPGSVAPAPVKVTVVAGSRASVKLSMGKDGVTVVVTGKCEYVMLSGDGDAMIGYQSCSGNSATFEHVAPGSYRACTAKDACTPFTVTASPAKQSVALSAPK